MTPDCHLRCYAHVPSAAKPVLEVAVIMDELMCPDLSLTAAREDVLEFADTAGCTSVH